MAEGISGLSDTIIRQVQYLVDVKGQSAVAELRNALDAVETKIRAQQVELAAGTISVQQFEKATASLVAQQISLQGQITLANAAIENGGQITGKLIQNLRQGEMAGRGMGQGMIQLSYALDDVQYGLMGIGNNIVPIISSFGVGGAFSGAIAFAAQGLVLYAQHGDKLNDLILAGIPITQSASARMAELAKNTHKTAEETAEFNKLKKEQHELMRVEAIRPEGEAESKKAYDEAIARGGGGEKVVGTMAAISLRSGLGKASEAERKIQQLKDQGFDALAAYHQKVYDDARMALAAENARSVLAGAATDPTKRAILEGVVGKNEAAFAPGFLGDLKRSSPEGRDAEAKSDAAFEVEQTYIEESGKAMSAQSKAARRAEAKAEKEVERVEVREERRVDRQIDSDVRKVESAHKKLLKQLAPKKRKQPVRRGTYRGLPGGRPVAMGASAAGARMAMTADGGGADPWGAVLGELREIKKAGQSTATAATTMANDGVAGRYSA